MSFRFPLQPVLDHRDAIERQHQVAVARARTVRDSAEARVRALQGELIAERESQRQIAAGDARGMVAVDRVKLAAAASLHAMVKLQRAAIELAGAQQRLTAAQVKLMAARVARKGVETLKERQRRRWLAEQERRETAALDDLNVMRAGFHAGEGGEP